MDEILIKINDLLELNKQEIKVGTNAHKDLILKMELQDRIMNELKVLARANKTLLGRIIKFPCADSYAVYVITKVNKKSVKIEWVDYCDGWQDDRAGVTSILDINYAVKTVQGEDMLDKLFNAKKAVVV